MAAEWTAGYVSAIEYTYGYYEELNPQRIKLAFLDAGLAFPEVGTACELGFGQGISVNVHAAASVTQWSGTDFNPAQAGFAQGLAKAAGAGARLYDEAFEQFCQREDLPDFDFICLHGIWSWISDDNRTIIRDFIGRKLKVGGVLYVSYNTQPGWSSMVPVRDLLAQHAEVMAPAAAGIVPRVESALGFVEKVVNLSPVFAAANPTIKARLATLQKMSRNYLAHEYFNQHWEPMSFAQMSGWLGDAKLDFACSANYLDHVDALNLNAEQLKLLAELPDKGFRETVRDFFTNQQFRRDYWVRGARRLTNLERTEAMRQLRVVLTMPRGDVTLTVKGAMGEGALKDSVYNPVLDRLADHKPLSVAELEHALREHGIGLAQLLQVLMVLVGKGALQLVQDQTAAHDAANASRMLNRKLCHVGRSTNGLTVLSSTVTGGGVAIGRFEQMFLLARNLGLETPQQWAEYAQGLLVQLNEQILHEGKALTSADDTRAELTRQAKRFAATRLPMLGLLGVQL